MLETTAFISTELHKNFKPFFIPDANEAQKQSAKDVLTARFEVLEHQLGDRAFIAGADMTVADCYLFVMLMWAAEKIGMNLPERLDAYYRRLQQRPSVARALAEEGLT